MHQGIQGVLMQLVLQPTFKWSFTPPFFPEISLLQTALCGCEGLWGQPNQQATMGRSCMEEFAQRGWSQSKCLEQQLCVGSCSLHLRFLIFRTEKPWSLNVLLRTSFCFQLKWCIYFMLGILKLLCTLTSFISASSLMHFTHSKIIRDTYEVNTMHNRLSYLVIFLLLVSFIHLHMWSLEMGRLPG